MDKNSLIIVFAVVLVSSFTGSLLGAYLVEKTGSAGSLRAGAPSLPQTGIPQTPGGASPQGGMPLQGGMVSPQGGQPAGQNLCGDGVCDSFEKQNNVCPEDCKK